MLNLLKTNKKGLSSTVATVLLITISIAAVIIIAFYIKQLSNQPALSPENCLNMQINPSIKILNACTNINTNDIEVKVSRTLDSRDISSLAFITQGAETHRWECSNMCGPCTILQQGQEKTYYFANTGSSAIKLEANGCLLETTSIKNNC